MTELGLCEASPEQAWLKEAMIARAAEVYIMADATKLGRASQQHWTAFPPRWTLITEATDARIDMFKALGATVLNPTA